MERERDRERERGKGHHTTTFRREQGEEIALAIDGSVSSRCESAALGPSNSRKRAIESNTM